MVESTVISPQYNSVPQEYGSYDSVHICLFLYIILSIDTKIFIVDQNIFTRYEGSKDVPSHFSLQNGLNWKQDDLRMYSKMHEMTAQIFFLHIFQNRK
jgi:hypothetical protein